VRPNWIVTGTDVATRLQKLRSFTFDGNVEGGMVQSGPFLFGTLQNRWRIVVDPLFPANKILMGYKGNQFFETGYVHAPYIPLIQTNVLMDPNDFTPRKGFMTRYGKKLISGDFYITVTITA